MSGTHLLFWTTLAAVIGLDGTLLATLAAVWFLVAPIAEEPWLEEHYGEAYRRYRDRVPQWMSVRRRPPQSAG